MPTRPQARNHMRYQGRSLDPVEVGARLRALRIVRGETQASLARRLGIPQHRVSELEHGTRPGVEANTLWCVCRALGCSLDEVVGMRDDVEPLHSSPGVAYTLP